jgi:site-specific recombinase XerD
MVNWRIKYIVEDVDRHGNVRIYFRRPGYKKIRLRGAPGSEEFQTAYSAALDNSQSGGSARKTMQAERGSLGWLCLNYYQSADFRRLDARTQHVRRLILDGLCQKGAGPLPYSKLTPLSVLKWRDAKADRPEAANSLIKALRQLYAFAIDYHHANKNPAKDVKYLNGNSEGFHSWSEEEIARFEAFHPVGSKAHLALALLLYTGQRRSDIVLFGRQHLRGEWLYFTQQKNRARKPITLTLPLHPELKRIIDATPSGTLAFLVTEFERPFTANGFGNRFRKWCDEAALPPECSAHGLRKAAATRLAEAGATELEIRAITGHQTSKEVSRYTKAASQKLLATSGMAKLTGNKIVPLVPIASVPPKKTEGSSI